MALLPKHSHNSPHSTLLEDTDMVFLRFTDHCRVHIFSPSPFDEVLDPDHHAFFIARNAEKNISLKGLPGILYCFGCKDSSCHVPLRIAGTSSIKSVAYYFCAKGIVFPSCGISCCNHIGMPFEENGFSRLAASQKCNDIRSAGNYFFHVNLEAFFY